MTLSESGTLVGMSVGVGGLVIATVSWAVRTHMDVKRHDAKLAGLAERQDKLDARFDALTQEVHVSAEAIADLETTVTLLTQSVDNHQKSIVKQFEAHEAFLDKRFEDLKMTLKEDRDALEKHRQFCQDVLAGRVAEDHGRMGAGEAIAKARKG